VVRAQALGAVRLLRVEQGALQELVQVRQVLV
jgi:hypothetical protein